MTTGLLAAHRAIASVPDFDDIETRLGVRAHTQGLNVLRETQREQGEVITGLRRDVDDLRR